MKEFSCKIILDDDVNAKMRRYIMENNIPVKTYLSSLIEKHMEKIYKKEA